MKAVTPVPVVEPVSSSEPESEPDDASSASSGEDSDSLDSDGPRKRRRTSPEADAKTDGLEEDDDDEEEEEEEKPKVKITPAFNVPSRIKRTQPGDKKAGQQVEATREAHPEPVSRVTAPTDAHTTFDQLGVRPWLVQSLANMAIKRPTAIQRESIPMLLKGRDCIGGSRTGSGKTVAFSVPILQQWAENPSAIFGVILTPTR